MQPPTWPLVDSHTVQVENLLIDLDIASLPGWA
jgi:hypothetical protein